MWKYASLSLLLLVPACAADRPNLTGKWLLDATHSRIRESKLKSETLEIAQTEADVTVSETVEAGGKQQKVEYTCPANGSECKTKNFSVMVYYNGPALIVTEMHHNSDIVLNKRLTASDDGKTLTIDVNYVAPPGMKDETFTFVKQ